MNGLVIQLILLLSSSCGYTIATDGYRNRIYVSNDGINDTSRCGSSVIPCSDLSTVLKQLALYNSTVIYLHPGTYELQANNQLKNLSNLAIIGLSTTNDDVIINCSREAGILLSFVDSVTIKSVIFSNCGALQSSTNMDLVAVNRTYVHALVAVYMIFCNNVTMSHVKWINSSGIALTLYNTVGTITIEDCLFSNLYTLEHLSQEGGGGLLIEFTYCVPQSTICHQSNVPSKYTSGAIYSIINTDFVNNTAYRSKIFNRNFFKFSNQNASSYNFGNGGGLSIILKGASNNNHFRIDNCTFCNNVAHYGGGFYIGFFDSSYDNNIEITHSNISENRNPQVQYRSHWDVDANGGGGTILYVSGDNGSNNVTIDGCIFSNNQALSGGGLSVQSVANFLHLKGFLTLRNLNFDSNSAYMGSAIYFFLDNDDSNYSVTIKLRDSNFTNNSPLCYDSVQRTLISLECRGIIYTVTQKLILFGTLNFLGNKDTSIEAHYTHIEVKQNARLLFSNNTSQTHGPAISLYACSYIKVFPETLFIFESNYARLSGGAIYSSHCSGLAQTAILSTNCFITYHNITVHPNDWQTSFIFYNNTEKNNKPNVLYAASLTSCWTSISNYSYRVNFREILCWKTWKYEDNKNCYDSISSGPSYMTLSEANKQSIIPGDVVPHPTIYDGRHNKYEETDLDFEIRIVSNKGTLKRNSLLRTANFTRKNHPKLYYYSNDSDYVGTVVKAVITATGDLQTTVEFTFKNCTWPFEMYSGCCALKIPWLCCTHDENSCGSACDYGSTIHPTRSYCISYNDDDFITGHCPLSYSNMKRFKFSSLPNEQDNFCNLNHTGVLCGQCKDGLSITVNTLRLDCVSCTDDDIVNGWLIIVFLEFLPVTLLVLLIVMFNVQLTKGIVCGFVLYCQLISVNFPGYYYPAWLALPDGTYIGSNEDSFLIGGIYSIPNLNFFFFFAISRSWKVCIAKNLTPLASIAFWYVIAFYPLLLLALFYLWLYLYGRGTKFIVILSIPFHKCLARFWRFFELQPSLTDSIASIYTLCFVQLTAISMQLVDYSTWQSLKYKERSGRVFFYDASLNYFGWPHAFFGLFAMIVLFFVIGIPTLSLLLYQFRWFHYFLRWLKLRHQLFIAVADAFTGQFKDGTMSKFDHRYFAGLYFLFRLASMSFTYIKINVKIILYCETIISTLFAGLIMIFRPYKEDVVNFIEFIIILSLGVMSALCLILEQKGRKVCIYGLIHIPLILLILCIMYFVIKKAKNKLNKKTSVPDITVQETDADSVTIEINVSKNDDFPDRVLNPNKYNERHYRFAPNEPSDEPNVDLPPVVSDGECTRITQCTRDSDYGSTSITPNY